MGKLIFVTGGARSGKSTFAEKTIKKAGKDIIYIATAIAFDEEMKQRIALHKKQRPSNWHTIEAYKNISEKLSTYKKHYDGVLLDCITIMINNIMMDEIVNWDKISIKEATLIEKKVVVEITNLINYIKKVDKLFVIVTNEVGSGIVPIYQSSRLFRDIAGRANQILANAADEAYLLVSSLPVKIK